MSTYNVKGGRVRAEEGTQGFDDAREFRVSFTFNGAAVLRIETPVNALLRYQGISLDSGTITMKAWNASQGVQSGTFLDSDNIIALPTNRMTIAPEYQQQTTYLTGGTFTPNNGEKPRELVKIVTANATAQRSTVGGQATAKRGVPPDTYYIVFEGNGVGQYNLTFEELTI